MFFLHISGVSSPAETSSASPGRWPLPRSWFWMGPAGFRWSSTTSLPLPHDGSRRESAVQSVQQCLTLTGADRLPIWKHTGRGCFGAVFIWSNVPNPTLEKKLMTAQLGCFGFVFFLRKSGSEPRLSSTDCRKYCWVSAVYFPIHTTPTVAQGWATGDRRRDGRAVPPSHTGASSMSRGSISWSGITVEFEIYMTFKNCYAIETC